MKTSAILDTNIVVDVLNGTPQAILWIHSLSKQPLGITPIVWMEVVRGARNNVERARTVRFLREFRIEHPTADDNKWAMLQFGRFVLSHRIDMTDIMIASVAARLAIPLYTLNIRHFAPLPDLDERQPY